MHAYLSDTPYPAPVQWQGSSDYNYSSNKLWKGHIPADKLVLRLLCCYLISFDGKLRGVDEQRDCLVVYLWLFYLITLNYML